MTRKHSTEDAYAPFRCQCGHLASQHGVRPVRQGERVVRWVSTATDQCWVCGCDAHRPVEQAAS